MKSLANTRKKEAAAAKSESMIFDEHRQALTYQGVSSVGGNRHLGGPDTISPVRISQAERADKAKLNHLLSLTNNPDPGLKKMKKADMDLPALTNLKLDSK